MALCLGECCPLACFHGEIFLEALYLGKVKLRRRCGGLFGMAFARRLAMNVALSVARQAKVVTFSTIVAEIKATVIAVALVSSMSCAKVIAVTVVIVA